MSRLLKVLVVDDSDADALLIFRKLRQEYYEPFSERVETAPELAKALTAHRWDIVLCDYKMPLLDSSRALEMVKAHDSTLPFVLISAFLNDAIAEKMVSAGADNYISKNNLDQLISILELTLVNAKIKRNKQKQPNRI